MEPYKIIEFNGKDEIYNKSIELPNDNEKYFLLVNAITDDRELLSYNSLIVKIEKEQPPDTDKESDSDSGSKWDNQSGGLPKLALALIIILAVLLALAIGFIFFRCVNN